ncbi:DnaJ domain protein [Leptospira inadai serovar Lyme str. 10]|uniref:DnaJ domain protein n=2 Tax=Leptospira inadai serovar Lyme TaxID=293084 RepID=V6HR87_9LEPT|nr:J domain-containing protein [Leptospira inadai]EQA35004.1 DnaJ domain protein [Leptospira inadai serovar Lyme str. 10]PNV74573.1 molecular chaperone DnaJ [Leptospira inadai serovar Lyme]
MTAKSFDQVKSSIEDILFEIQSSSTDCEWYISADKLIEILDIRREDYYKILYGLRADMAYSSKGAQGFRESRADILVLLLGKILKIEGLEHEFAKAGVYFDDVYLEELRIHLKEIVIAKLDKHDLDKDLLLLLISSTKRFEDAFDSYFDDKFDLGRLVDNGIAEFLDRKSIPADYGADVFLRKYFYQILNTKVFPLREFTAEYRDRAYYEIFGRFRKDEQKKKKAKAHNRRSRVVNSYEEDEETRRHRDFLGLAEDYDSGDLRKKYKELIKKYHPDVNKDGLEMTQRIVASYNYLVMKGRSE